jgi:peptidoglycan-associated lipoprotein
MRRAGAWLPVIVVVGLVGAACHRRPPVVASTVVPPRPAAEAVPPPAPPPPPVRPTVAAVAPPTLSEEEQFRRMSLDDLNAEPPLGDVFFDYAQAILTDTARAALQRDQAWLLKWTSTSIRISGHADERGTAEYNLALGERRATATRDYLASLGVSPTRMTVVSFGKEQPFCRDSVESCWSQNRRAHFLITAK